ncbi:efflux RND transporter periplasmic adaptor subunit [Acidihalobacter prosperus]
MTTRALFSIILLAVISFISIAYGNSNDVTVHEKTYTRYLTAYARVTPISAVQIRAREKGIVHYQNKIIPGQQVKAGEILGHLAGPYVKAKLSTFHSIIRKERTQLKIAKLILKTEHIEHSLRVNTYKALYRAQADVGKAHATLQVTLEKFRAFRDNLKLRAPFNGTISKIDTGSGEQAWQQQNLLTLLNPEQLWLLGRFYGQEVQAVHPGMEGTFMPSDGMKPLKVKVVSLLPVMQTDGARLIGLKPLASNPEWVDGEAGKVSLRGKKISAVAVPTRALVLDKGQWWVLVHRQRGNQRLSVSPGPSRGDWTLIPHGLKPGTRIIVNNAYIKFHSNISAHYMPPD